MKQVYIVRSQNQLTLIPRVKHFQTIPYIPKTDLYIFKPDTSYYNPSTVFDPGNKGLMFETSA